LGTNIVITMAGRGSRFVEAGYSEPKYELQAHGRSLFEWSMRSLDNFTSRGARVVFVCLRENGSEAYVRAEARRLGLRDVHVLELEGITDGQATTAYLSRELWQAEEPLLIYNIDTFVDPRALRPESIREGSDGWIPCFPGTGDHWSFVELGADGWATRVVEKERISPHASVGLYWFASTASFLDAYDDSFTASGALVQGERFVAPLYRKLIADGRRVSVAGLQPDDVHVLGTPRELEEFRRQSGFSPGLS
jgi:hypothetical protein